jgi:arginyl-tRNA synthetase
MKALVQEKLSSTELGKYTESEVRDISDAVAVGAIKYSVLRQTIGKDIIFDDQKSISFEGDSGPYVQYTYVRTKSILHKADAAGIEAAHECTAAAHRDDVPVVQKLLYIFPEIVERAARDISPNYIATYITEVASAFNAYYATTKIIDPENSASKVRVALTEAVGWVLKNGLWLLGIQAPSKM